MFKIVAGGELLFSTEVNTEGMEVVSPTCSLSLGGAGTVAFTLLPTHHLYSRIKKLATKVSVYFRDFEIFRGRILDWDDDFYRQRKVSCEGALSYLLDSVQSPFPFDGTVDQYFGYVINAHNQQVEETKRFLKGTISSKKKKQKTYS